MCDGGAAPEQLNPEKPNYYKELDVAFGVDANQLRAAYLRLALRYHPDKHPGDAAATSRFQRISEAFRVLSDPVLRKQYDASTAFDVECMPVEEYLARFSSLILTTSGLTCDGMDSTDLLSLAAA